MAEVQALEIPDVDPVRSPFLFALLAADIAGFSTTPPEGERGIDANLLDGDFQLMFEVQDGVDLTISHNAAKNSYLISVIMADRDAITRLAPLALQFNHLAPRKRRFSVDPLSKKLFLSEIAEAIGLELDQLAERITDLCVLMIGLSERTLQPDAAIDRPVTTNMIRG